MLQNLKRFLREDVLEVDEDEKIDYVPVLILTLIISLCLLTGLAFAFLMYTILGSVLIWYVVLIGGGTVLLTRFLNS